MDSAERASILLVDDESTVLAYVSHLLSRRFEVTTAQRAATALEILKSTGPYAIVVSDLNMPGMDGVTFLSQVRQMKPDTVRILLTGQADLRAAVAAVNQGHVFRFLSKPCVPEELLSAVDAAADYYRLVTSERVLLEQTLAGSIKTLTDVLALANPMAFGRASRAKQHVTELADHLGVQDRWQVEIAAMLSQIACVALPPETQAKVYYGHELSQGEREMTDRLPGLSDKLLANIPRLEPVRRILAYRDKLFDGSGPPSDGVRGDAIPWGARILKVVLDFDVLQAQGLSVELALATMRGRVGHYDAEIFGAFAGLLDTSSTQMEVTELPLRAVSSGMVFVDDVKTKSGSLLIARGQKITPELLERIRNLSPRVAVREPVRVAIKSGADEA